MTTAESRHFPAFNLETAPSESRARMAATQGQFGFLPLPIARHAAAPSVLEGFALLHELFEHSSLSPLAREAVALTLAREFDCALCRNLHSQIARSRGASAELVSALLAGNRSELPEIDAIVQFTEQALATHGAVSDAALDAFMARGFTPRQALEVVTGIATYTLSIFANRMTRSETLR
jgi:AhpD family alkylhydroperoxidase